MFAADGMRPDKALDFARKGHMPAVAEMVSGGVRGANGMLQTAPPNTGSGWYTMASGAWSGTHGSTNNTFAVNGDPSTVSTSAFAPGSFEAESIGKTAEEDGKKVASIEWVGGRVSSLTGPVTDFRSFHSSRGVTTTYVGERDDPDFIEAFGLDYDEVALQDATGLTNVPAGDAAAPPKETVMTVRDFGELSEAYSQNVYIFDSVEDGNVNYDRVFLTPFRTKDGADKTARLGRDLAHDAIGVPRWDEFKLTIAGGSKEGRTGGMYVKLERMTSDLSKFRLYHTSVQRIQASWEGHPDFEDHLAEDFLTATAADFAPLEAGIVSERTYVQQGVFWERAYHPIIREILDRYRPDLAMVGYPVTDEFQHQFAALVGPKAGNPVWDDADRDDVRDHLVRRRKGYIRRAYKGADATLEVAQAAMRTGPLYTAVGADHGFAPHWKSLSAGDILERSGLQSSAQTSNCATASDDTLRKVRACWAGGTVQFYVNLEGRDEGGTVAPEDYEAVRGQIVEALETLADPDDPDATVIPEDNIFMKEDTDRIPAKGGPTVDMLHPTRTGDVVAFAAPPYQWDAATPGREISDAPFFGQHGYRPDLVDLDRDINMHAAFFFDGPGVREGAKVRRVRAI
ncbi:MAG: alkaline phosphatase family protein, partial [Actinobacteria bacterium]|nr:alkaline phosphatase family protein [Actinomycetota bacterium]